MGKSKKIVRRPNGEGSVYQMKDGRFGTAVSLGKDESGKRLRHVETGKTEQEALDKMHLWLSKNGYLEEKKVVINGQTPVEEFVEEFKKYGLKDSGISDVTYDNYCNMLRPFTSAFTGRRIGEIDTDEINKFFARMSNEIINGHYQYGQISLNRTAYLVGRMFKRAVRKNYLLHNPVDNGEFKKPNAKKVSKEVTALTPDELSNIMSALKQHDTIYPVVNVMIHTGMRTQEALALKWGDIDFENACISISRALTKKMLFDEHGNRTSTETTVGLPKTKTGIREILVPDSLIEYLMEWREKAPTVSKTKTSDEDFVFGTVKGPSWTCDGFRSALNRYLKKSETGIDGLRPHRLRHTAATLLSNQPDATVFHVMQLLGHKDSRMAQKYVDKQREERAKKNKEMLEQISKGLNF